MMDFESRREMDHSAAVEANMEAIVSWFNLFDTESISAISELQDGRHFFNLIQKVKKSELPEVTTTEERYEEIEKFLNESYGSDNQQFINPEVFQEGNEVQFASTSVFILTAVLKESLEMISKDAWIARLQPLDKQNLLSIKECLFSIFGSDMKAIELLYLMNHLTDFDSKMSSQQVDSKSAKEDKVYNFEEEIKKKNILLDEDLKLLIHKYIIELERKKMEHDDQKIEFDASLKENKNLMGEIQKVQEMLTDFKTKMTQKLEEKCLLEEKYKKELEDLKIAKEKQQTDVQLNVELEERMEFFIDKKNQVQHEANMDISVLKDKIKTLECQRGVAQEEMDYLKEIISEKENNLASLISENSKKDFVNQQQKAVLYTLTGKISHYENQIKGYKEQINQMVTAEACLIATQNEKTNSLLSKVASCEREKDEYRLRIAESAKQIEDLRDSNCRLSSEKARLQNYKTEVGELEERIVRLQAEKSNYQKERDRASNELSQFKEAFDELNSANSQLLHTNSMLELKNNQLESEIDKKVQECVELSNQVDRFQKWDDIVRGLREERQQKENSGVPEQKSHEDLVNDQALLLAQLKEENDALLKENQEIKKQKSRYLDAYRHKLKSESEVLKARLNVCLEQLGKIGYLDSEVTSTSEKQQMPTMKSQIAAPLDEESRASLVEFFCCAVLEWSKDDPKEEITEHIDEYCTILHPRDDDQDQQMSTSRMTTSIYSVPSTSSQSFSASTPSCSYHQPSQPTEVSSSTLLLNQIKKRKFDSTT